MITFHRIRDEASNIMNKYDPENDLGSPRVTHTDQRLLDMVLRLTDIVEAQQKELVNLSANLTTIKRDLSALKARRATY